MRVALGCVVVALVVGGCSHRAVEVALLRQAIRAAVRAAHFLHLSSPALKRGQRAVAGGPRGDDRAEEGLCVAAQQWQAGQRQQEGIR